MQFRPPEPQTKEELKQEMWEDAQDALKGLDKELCQLLLCTPAGKEILKDRIAGNISKMIFKGMLEALRPVFLREYTQWQEQQHGSQQSDRIGNQGQLGEVSGDAITVEVTLLD
jgi:hypothetical protein